MDGNSFYLKLDAVKGHVFYTKVDESIMWHKRYGHFNLKSLKFMHDASMVIDMPEIHVSDQTCDSYYNMDAFRGTAPINLTDTLHQVLRWATDFVEIFFSHNNALLAGPRLNFLQRVAYINVGLYPFTSIFLIAYYFLPFWLIGGASSHIVAVLQGLVIAGIEISFALTSKSASDEDDDFADLYTIKWSFLMIPPITVNLIGIAVGVCRTIYGANPQWGQLLGEVFFSFWVLAHLYPSAKGLMGRQERTSTVVYVWSGLVAISICLLWVVTNLTNKI
ncbi:hypothetical protein POTOM_006881 [Populus tomentosa]|uniref:GAG-pre-integrase domain-containing protein n=1 Tax=Populus tomentosa TaxID=118781 RepID=A0A8X8D7V0_POPTO|nr:hypothetical protein POTOM_006881 [Populus tomentosa]